MCPSTVGEGVIEALIKLVHTVSARQATHGRRTS